MPMQQPPPIIIPAPPMPPIYRAPNGQQYHIIGEGNLRLVVPFQPDMGPLQLPQRINPTEDRRLYRDPVWMEPGEQDDSDSNMDLGPME